MTRLILFMVVASALTGALSWWIFRKQPISAVAKWVMGLSFWAILVPLGYLHGYLRGLEWHGMKATVDIVRLPVAGVVGWYLIQAQRKAKAGSAG